MGTLTKHFNLDEFFVSADFPELIKRDEAPLYIENSFFFLCEHVLEHIRRIYRTPIYITSGYRSPELNAKVSYTKHSLHQEGLACDFTIENRSALTRIYDLLKTGFGHYLSEAILYRDKNGENINIHVALKKANYPETFKIVEAS